MERRTFLKGALIASATPAVVFAPALVASIAGLIASYADVRDEITKLNAQSDAIWERADRPPISTMTRVELGMPYALRVKHPEIRLRKTLEQAFTDELDIIEFNVKAIGMPAKSAERARDRIAADRERILALWDERQAGYFTWAEVSGYDDLNSRIDHLYRVEANLDDQIINWRCETLEDVRLKAAHVERVYEGQMPTETAAAVIRSLMV